MNVLQIQHQKRAFPLKTYKLSKGCTHLSPSDCCDRHQHQQGDEQE